MKRQHLHLTDQHAEHLKKLSERECIPVAILMRQALKTFLKKKENLL
jgi:hypothetical protein|tara:strand:- start:1117 stop:1257 length:141 start_codon:yes stop_codon:yes gene_type:complete